jgi:hypothetical protein
MSDCLDQEIGTNYLLGSDKSFRSMGGCSLLRPDKLYGSGGLVFQYECDEHEHKWENGTYACDEKRISDIYDEFPGKTHVVIRWNPDSYRTKEKKPKRKERLRLLIKLHRKLVAMKHTDPIHIYYMFYSKDNPRIAKKIPYTFIYNDSDIDNL